MSRELIGVEDIFENDEFVLMKALFSESGNRIEEFSVGCKDRNGDIIKIVTVNSEISD